jgi:activator of HSP90 ATPase
MTVPKAAPTICVERSFPAGSQFTNSSTNSSSQFTNSSTNNSSINSSSQFSTNCSTNSSSQFSTNSSTNSSTNDLCGTILSCWQSVHVQSSHESQALPLPNSDGIHDRGNAHQS